MTYYSSIFEPLEEERMSVYPELSTPRLGSEENPINLDEPPGIGIQDDAPTDEPTEWAGTGGTGGAGGGGLQLPPNWQAGGAPGAGGVPGQQIPTTPAELIQVPASAGTETAKPSAAQVMQQTQTLQGLQQLRDAGSITPEEYVAGQAELLRLQRPSGGAKIPAQWIQVSRTSEQEPSWSPETQAKMQEAMVARSNAEIAVAEEEQAQSALVARQAEADTAQLAQQTEAVTQQLNERQAEYERLSQEHQKTLDLIKESHLKPQGFYHGKTFGQSVGGILLSIVTGGATYKAWQRNRDLELDLQRKAADTEQTRLADLRNQLGDERAAMAAWIQEQNAAAAGKLDLLKAKTDSPVTKKKIELLQAKLIEEATQQQAAWEAAVQGTLSSTDKFVPAHTAGGGGGTTQAGAKKLAEIATKVMQRQSETFDVDPRVVRNTRGEMLGMASSEKQAEGTREVVSTGEQLMDALDRQDQLYREYMDTAPFTKRSAELAAQLSSTNAAIIAAGREVNKTGVPNGPEIAMTIEQFGAETPGFLKRTGTELLPGTKGLVITAHSAKVAEAKRNVQRQVDAAIAQLNQPRTGEAIRQPAPSEAGVAGVPRGGFSPAARARRYSTGTKEE